MSSSNSEESQMNCSFDTEEELLLDDESEEWLLLQVVGSRSTDAHDINKKRSEFGEFHHLYQDLRTDEEKFFQYMRMYPPTFDYLCNSLHSELVKEWCNIHKRPIGTEERLMLSIRYLSTGMSFRGLASTFRMGASTVSTIVAEVVRAIWKVLQKIHMPIPKESDFLKISEDFYKLWNFPNCVGSLDGKHVRVISPARSGSMHFNYKLYFSIVLQGIADANYKFISIEVGGYGKQSDGGTFRASKIFEKLQNGTLDLPAPKELPNSTIKVPFVFIADDAYPLLNNVLKPYKGEALTADCEYYNKRLSRARRTVECAFGILYAKWRLLGKSIETNVCLADDIVKAICVLHNLLIDKEGMCHNLRDLTLIPSANENTGGRHPGSAVHVRDIFKLYFCKNAIIHGENVSE